MAWKRLDFQLDFSVWILGQVFWLMGAGALLCFALLSFAGRGLPGGK
ncbi:hypothetical protein [Polaromonas sp. CG_9.11]|nr:hypothetical protein [Polaromonas sp. CG_9.11]